MDVNEPRVQVPSLNLAERSQTAPVYAERHRSRKRSNASMNSTVTSSKITQQGKSGHYSHGRPQKYQSAHGGQFHHRSGNHNSGAIQLTQYQFGQIANHRAMNRMLTPVRTLITQNSLFCGGATSPSPQPRRPLPRPGAPIGSTDIVQ